LLEDEPALLRRRELGDNEVGSTTPG
jgi:hypothetical protein